MLIFLKDDFKWDADFYRHCWEALISSNCVGTVLWQHWYMCSICIILYHFDQVFSFGMTWNDLTNQVMLLDANGIALSLELQKRNAFVESLGFLDFLTNDDFAKVAPGVCWNLLWVWICPRTKSSKRRELFIESVYTMLYIQIQARPDKAFHKFNLLIILIYNVLMTFLMISLSVYGIGLRHVQASWIPGRTSRPRMWRTWLHGICLWKRPFCRDWRGNLTAYNMIIQTIYDWR